MRSKHRWFVLAVFYGFILLHQADKLLIAPLTTPIIEDFHITQEQMGAVSSLAIVVAAVLYPLWGYLYDRFARARLLALASFIWGATTWLNALARSYGVFLVTRGSTGIDDSSYPGIYSLLSDYFGPRIRGRVYGLLQTAVPFGYMLGLILSSALGGVLGWRKVFFITGGVGILISIIIFLGVREAPRGGAEPEMASLEVVPTLKFSWPVARQLLQRPSMRLIYVQGFFGVFPWQVITFWFFRYLEKERGFTQGEAMMTMMVGIVALAAGYFLGGSLGDLFFRRTPKGRVLTANVGVVLGAVLLLATISMPLESRLPFTLLMGLTGLTMSWGTANVTASIQDVAEPEVRSTAAALGDLIGNIGSAVAPWLAGFIADRSSLKVAILSICLVTWSICAVFMAILSHFIPADINRLRQTMQERAGQARRESSPAG
jgi:MFS family permease